MTSSFTGELFHVASGDEHSSTIVLLHGLTSSHFGYTETGIAASLSSTYHVLVPDLPSHSGSMGCGPYTFENITSKLVSLVTKYGKNGRAHVFGFSGGGFAALHLAKHYPELVETLIISGVQDQPSFLGYYTTFLAAPVAMIEKHLVPHSIVKKIQKRIGITVPEAVGRECSKNQTYSLVSTAWVSLREIKLPPRSEEKDWELPMRCLALAGEKQDHVKGVQELGRALRRGNRQSRAGKVPGAPHWWFLDRPELLVDTIIAWIEGKELPAGIEDLEIT